MLAKAARSKCFIEYIPAENARVPIVADGYLYINCLWVSGSMKGSAFGNYKIGILYHCKKEVSTI